MKRKKKVTGRIILVQEDRFRMVDGNGAGYLFSLSRKARTSAKDLKRWHVENVRVIVEYRGESNLESGVAQEVTPMLMM